MTYFISGHGSLTIQQFSKHYVPRILKAMSQPKINFIVGDFKGVDTFAQNFLQKHLVPRIKVTVYHMFENPRTPRIKGFTYIGGFTSDNERDTAMTNASDADIALILKGKEKSGTAKNILRRLTIS